MWRVGAHVSLLPLEISLEVKNSNEEILDLAVITKN